MAIFHQNFLEYISEIYSPTKSLFFENLMNDPVLVLAEYFINDEPKKQSSYTFHNKMIQSAKYNYEQKGILGVIDTYFSGHIVNPFVDKELERKIFVLKKGMKALPATKAVIVFKGFGNDLTEDQMKLVYSSYGLSNWQKKKYQHVDFMDINRRVEGLAYLLDQPISSLTDSQYGNINELYLGIRAYNLASEGERVKQIPKGIEKSLFYYYLDNVYKYGMLGLFGKNKSAFRQSRIKPEYESTMVINKIQHPENKEQYYLDYLRYNGVEVKKGSVGKIFKRWNVSGFHSAFISNLERLENFSNIDDLQEVQEERVEITQASDYKRYVDSNFILYLKGIEKYPLHIDAPGLFVLWYYFEKLGIYQLLESLNLTKTDHGYSWIDYLLFTIGRIFYGIPTYNAGCLHEEPSISFFSQLLKPPCLSNFLSGLGSIPESCVFTIQKWIPQRLKELNLAKGKRIILDFNQIDLDVNYENMRQFGKGPSPKKKICYSGFRPHIAWDADTGSLLVAEFRKSSARGTTTIRRYVKDFLEPVFKKLFEEVYIDSEYTGMDVWNFIMDDETGMNSQLIGCLKQNPFVKKHRNKFLMENQEDEKFWKYWNEDHIYSSTTFSIKWDYNKSTGENASLSLNCVIKKNIKSGKYRCFGSSHLCLPEKILVAYSNRWGIENGIKDLIHSYYFDKCPGTENPNLVNVHFLIVTICKSLYRMIQEDAKEFLTNKDGTIKTLQTMRNKLFKQGCGKIIVNKDTIEVYIIPHFSVEQYNYLKNFYDKILKDYNNGLKIIGDFKLKFSLKAPHGSEFKNSGKKSILSLEKFTKN